MMTNLTPLVSIIIPVYNAQKYLRACIDSCLCQSYSDFEIVAVNDGSGDGSLAMLREYQSIDSRIKVFDKANQGLPLTRQYGVERAGGKYIFFLDSDDTITPNALEVMQAKATQTGSDIVIGNLITVLESGRVIGSHKNYFVDDYINSIGPDLYLASILAKSILPSLCGRLIEKSLFDGVEFPAGYTMGEDVITNLRIIEKHTPSVVLVDDVIYNYIQHQGSMSNVNNRANANKRMKFVKNVYGYYQALGSPTKDSIKNQFDRFIIEEYFSFLRDGGRVDFCSQINDYVNNIGLCNSAAVAELPSWRVLMLRCYRASLVLGNIYRYAFVRLRALLR